MKRLLMCACLLAALPVLAATDPEPKIQVAILLDTSSSMDGLINQTREQLWKIVNTLAAGKKDGKKAKLELALYEYGNDRLSSEGGYIRQVSPLSQNLDAISEQLFALRTNGGSEYCGMVIQKAVDQLAWSKDPHDLKLIYIAGNEEFTQGPVDFHKSVKNAVEHGITVNTIHCGDEQAGIAGQWKAAASLADGRFIVIDQDKQIAQVAAPQDKEIAELGVKLNGTYIGYGADAPGAVQRQAAQDKNAAGVSAGNMAMRAVSKSSAAYDNSGWDLVDAKKKGKDLSKIDAEALPPPMRAMKPAERDAFVDGKMKERVELQNRINTLNTEREKFVTVETEKQAKAGGAKTLDSALIESAKAEGGKQAFSF